MVKDIATLERNPLESKELRDFTMEISQYIFSQSQENLVNNGSSDTGFLLRATPPYWDGDKVIFHYTAPYAEAIEYGTDPHSMPVTPLIKWAKKKLSTKKKKLTDKQAIRAAWAIRTKIAKEGTEAQPFIRPAIDASRYKFDIPNNGYELIVRMK